MKFQTIVDLQKKLVSVEKEKQKEKEKERSVQEEKLTVDQVVNGAKALGLKPMAASFLRGQLVNCSRALQGKQKNVPTCISVRLMLSMSEELCHLFS